MRFNYERFKNALKKVEEERFLALKRDIEQVKAFVEKALTMFLESSANTSRASYLGVDL